MRKSVILAVLLVLTSVVSGTEALVSPYEEEIVLKPSNDYSIELDFYAGMSEPENASFIWHRLENASKMKGPSVSYEVDRQGWSKNTLRLIVASDKSSDSLLVKQDIQDKPNISISVTSRHLNISKNNSVKLRSEVTDRFDNTEVNKVNYTWQVGNSTFSTEKSAMYSFSRNGTYNFSLSVSDASGLSARENILIHVTGYRVKENKSGDGTGGSSGTGAGGGGSSAGSGSASSTPSGSLAPEDSNVNDSKGFLQKQGSGPVVDITSSGQYRVRQVENYPGNVSEPPGRVYSKLSIRSEGAEKENVSIVFKVKKSWIQRNNVSADQISLYRYHRGWKMLSTKLVSYKINSVQFKASTSGFSYFAVATTSNKSFDRSNTTCKANCSEKSVEGCLDDCNNAKESSNRGLLALLFKGILGLGIVAFGILTVNRVDLAAIKDSINSVSELLPEKQKKKEVEEQMTRIKSKLSNNVQDLDRNEIMHNLNRASTLINSGRLDEAEDILDNVEKEIDG
ncbi:MAG: PGF-pre-PGF domain-containing protein [Candidatus Nanosalina sp.]